MIKIIITFPYSKINLPTNEARLSLTIYSSPGWRKDEYK